MSPLPRLDLAAGVALRPWRSADAGAVLAAMSDPQVRRYAGVLAPDLAAAERMVARRLGSFSAQQGASWAMVEADRLVGSVTFQVLDGHLLTGSVGYWLLPPARGRGLAAAAVRAGTRHVLRELGWHRIELYHAVDNPRSCAVAVRAGFRYEGTMRQAMHYPDPPRWSDEHLHARLRADPDPVPTPDGSDPVPTPGSGPGRR